MNMFPLWLNKAFFYILAWCLYDLQGLIVSKGSPIAQFVFIILLIISLYYFFVANIYYKLPIYFKGLNTLLAMFSVYGIFLIIGGYDAFDYHKQVPSFNYLKNIYISLLPVYAFYVFKKEGLITKRTLKFFIVAFFGFVTIKYFQNQREMLAYALLINSTKDEFTNNMGYLFLSLFPACVYFYKTPLLQYILIGYCFVFLLMGMKRGAIIIGVVCLFWFFLKSLKNASAKKKIGLLLLSVGLCYAGYAFAHKQMESSLYFQKRIEDTLEGNSSHRDDLYSHFAYYFWNETSPLQFIFGTGANGTLKVSYNYAHNDWLEIAVNQGLLGIIVYLFYWIAFAKNVIKTKSTQEKFALQLLFIIYFMRTIFSMSYGAMTIPATIILGYSFAQEKENEEIIHSIKTDSIK